MAPGTHCNVSAAFAPAVEGTAAGTLSISAAGSVYPVTLAGVGVARVASVSVSPASLSFGSVAVGITSAAQNVQVTNTGSVGMSVSSVTITGPFAISQNSCLASGTWNGVMAPGTKCDLYVVFAPTVAGTAAGTFIFSDTATAYLFTLALPGALPVSSVSVAPASLSFGSLTTGATSAAQDVQITSTGSAGVSVSSVTITGPFAISQNSCLASGTWNGVIAPGTKCDLYVVFAPTAGGTATGTLSISALGNVYPVTLAGTGVLPPDTTPPTVSITAPAANSSVSGTVAVSATASDNVGVAGVQFKLDNINIGSEFIAVPYALTWDTTGAPNGSHTLTALARDAAGNTTTSAAVTVTVNNDLIPPVLSGVTASSIGPDTAAITWATNGLSASRVEFGLAHGCTPVTSLSPML